jgi:hypothetical protein
MCKPCVSRENANGAFKSGASPPYVQYPRIVCSCCCVIVSFVSESDTTTPDCIWSTEYGERGKDDIDTIPRFGNGKGMPKVPVPDCGIIFSGMGRGADTIAALAGLAVTGIDSITNIRTIPKIDVSCFISA